MKLNIWICNLWNYMNIVIFLSFKQYDLRILSERTTYTTIITRDKRQKDFPWGNHKGENPTTYSEIKWAQMAAVKPRKMTSIVVLSLSLERASPFSLMRSSEWVCMWCVEMRRASLLFIFFRSLYVHSNKSSSLKSYLPWLNCLGESNNPSAPQLWGLCPPINKEG